ncbi:uncharacterized protein LOC133529130 isoform X1 [Cydia pomonella]|uniref:uncharacterized protein LOC133529130 isoform X1 n=1 Tax=Cydia pomonella TaxID=82600 RepID=UPI002ADDA93C|nr:uncharacterized protein LOC133529130 isoform X1 [Cydia pomonella]
MAFCFCVGSELLRSVECLFCGLPGGRQARECSATVVYMNTVWVDVIFVLFSALMYYCWSFLGLRSSPPSERPEEPPPMSCTVMRPPKPNQSKDQVTALLAKIPILAKTFDIHRKIGEGTFSSVYLGSIKQDASVADGDKRLVLLRLLYVG